MTRRRSFLICVCLALIIAAKGALLQAHPTAETFVTVTLGDRGGVSVTVSSDARALALKLEALGGSLASHVDLECDGQPVPLTQRGTKDVPGRPGFAAIELTGVVPASARQLTFRSTAILGVYPLLVRHANQPAASDDRYEWVSGADISRVYDLAALDATADRSAFGDAVWLGFTHIVPKGLDHILFVLGLFLLTTRMRPILVQVSAFTLAHSLTLGLGLAGLVSLPSSVVEPLIALSIVYVGVENLRSTALGRSRVVIVFAFGLLHGLGFAEALASMDLSRIGWLATLAGFNVGVELGQLAVIGAAALGVAAIRVEPSRYRAWIVRPASLAIAAAGVLWLIERTS
jgi:hypothetical protein